MNINFVLYDLLHVCGVEIAKAHCFYTFVFSNVT